MVAELLLGFQLAGQTSPCSTSKNQIVISAQLNVSFTLTIGELECLYQTQSLVDWASDRQIVDGDLTQVLFAVNDEKSAEWDTRLFLQDAVAASDSHRLVSQQRISDVAQASFFAWSVDPSQVSKMRISWHSDHFAVEGAELLNPLRERDDFRWADECTGRKEIRKKTLSPLFTRNQKAWMNRVSCY